jgi:cysteine desulfurase
VDIENTYKLKCELKSFLKEELKDLGGVLDVAPSNSNTIYFYLNHLTSDISLALFDLHGLMISAGSACSSGTARPSNVLREAHLNGVARNGLRLSLNFATTSDEIQKIKSEILLVFKKMRLTMPRY